ncbi:MAG: Hsp20/alpha crystallin family protein [Planctomycetia bacterium]|nr:Hsp20/alpha crystallin family protein [Planctomycetia bacterium]
MTAWRTNGLPSVNQLRTEMDRLVGDFFGGVSTAMPRTFASIRAFPAVNVWEKGNELFAEAELAGLKTEDVDISVTGNELTIRGRRPEAAADEALFHRRERGAGEFSRTLRLPYEVDGQHVEATLRDGVLSIRLPKAASARPRKIHVAAK